MILCIIQARMSSTRLPGKALKMIAGLPVIQHVINRACEMPVDKVCLAVPWSDENEPLIAWARYEKNPKFAWRALRQQNENDVLERFAMVLSEFPNADPIVRVTGDCPALDPKIGADVLALYQQSRGWCEYAWNVAHGYIDGTDVEVMSRDALERADRYALFPDDREHVGQWIRRNVKNRKTLQPTEDHSKLKLSIDTEEDYQFVKQWIERGESLRPSGGDRRPLTDAQ